MKKLSIILSLLFICMIPWTILAEEMEDNESYDEGGFIAPSIKMTKFNDDLGTMLGIRVGSIMQHSFTLEGSFYGLITEVDSPRQGSNIGVGYSGLTLEYTILPDKKIHILVNTMVGVGRVSYKRNYDEPRNPDKDKLNSIIIIVEPGAGLEFCVTRYFRIALGVSYRSVEGVDLKNLSNDDINGITGTLALRFGAF
jgi:hypothetical protein